MNELIEQSHTTNKINEAAKVVVLSGATGFIGHKLVVRLLAKGYDVRVLSRDARKARLESSLPISFYSWDAKNEMPPVQALADAFAIVHLAGESVAAGRWTNVRKQEIMDSRRKGTHNLVERVMQLHPRPSVFVSASAIGFYGDRNDELLSEESSPGDDFLASVCQHWESEAQRVGEAGVRWVSVRTGIVLDANQGALAKMLPPFTLGLGGPLAGGQAWMSWIHVDDLVDIYLRAIEDNNYSGPINAVAPEPVRNVDFTKELARCLGRPALLPVPKMGLRLIWGEMSEILLASQQVSALKLKNLGFKFSYAKLSTAFNHLLCFEGSSARRLRSEVWVPYPVERVFEFFSQPQNLMRITPHWLDFKIVRQSRPDVGNGVLIDYELKLRGVPLKWQSIIEAWQTGSRFIDRQVKGPYKFWVHEHRFIEIKSGTLIVDQVYYKLPVGVFGDLAYHLWVKRDLERIFEFRNRIIQEEVFPQVKLLPNPIMIANLEHQRRELAT